jgi:hypothetical protein
VRDLVAKDAVVRLTERRERQRIGRRAVKHHEHFTLRFKDVADEVGCLRGPRVVAVTDFMSRVSLRERGEGFWADAGVVVAGEWRGLEFSFMSCPKF